MTTSPPRGPQGRRRPAPLRAVVVRTAQLTPHLTRVTVTGEDFDRFRWPGPAGHFKLMLPEPGAADVNLPEADASGTVAFTGTAMPTMRTYTASQFRADTKELDIDVVLHGDGPATAWALQARPGGRLAVTVPRSAGFTEDPTADWVLLAGDASALPAIATIAPSVTKPLTILLEVGGPAEQLDLGHPVQWLTAADPTGNSDAPTPLEQAVRSFIRPAGRGQMWVAGEAAVIRRIRAALLAGLDRDQVVTRGYWRAGEQNHPDHDYGDDN